jgi:hypothetical protein
MYWFKQMIPSVAIVSTIVPTLAPAQIPLVGRLEVLKDVGDAVGAAGDAISKLTDGIAHLVSTANSGWAYVSASNVKSRLNDISARATSLAAIKNVRVVESIDEYLKHPHPTIPDWDAVNERFAGVIIEVKGLLDNLKSERSDFIREDAYAKLVQTLASRSSLLDKLRTLPPPETSEERKALRLINDKYKVLILNFQAAVRELNAYLKQVNPG